MRCIGVGNENIPENEMWNVERWPLPESNMAAPVSSRSWVGTTNRSMKGRYAMYGGYVLVVCINEYNQRSDISQMESEAQIHVPDMESRHFELCKCTKEYAVAVCLLFSKKKCAFLILIREF